MMTAKASPEPFVIELANIQEWCAFARDHREALIEDYGSIKDALDAALAGELELGGGGAPLFLVKFADDPEAA